MPTPVPQLPAGDFAARKVLEQAADVFALASGGIHLGAAPQDERRPRIVVSPIGGERFRKHTAAAGESSLVGCEVAAVQVDCLAANVQAARRLALLAAPALEAFTGQITVDGAAFQVHWIEAEPERQTPSDPQAGTTPTYGFSFEAELMLSQP
jgi:hypothetical protein